MRVNGLDCNIDAQTVSRPRLLFFSAPLPTLTLLPSHLRLCSLLSGEMCL